MLHLAAPSIIALYAANIVRLLDVSFCIHKLLQF